MSVLYTNNAKTTLSADLSNSATSLGVASSSGFPSLSGSHYFYATLDDTTNLEVVKVTAVSGTTWTIVRAQDNTTARAYGSGDTVELRLNAALLTDVVNDALASSFTRQEFTGNGSTTAYTLNKTPNSENDLLVFIEGVFQTQSVYSLSGTTLTFSTAPANTRKIIVYHVSASVSGDSLALNTFSGNGSTTAFTMSVDPLYENNTMVFIDGVYQNKSTYATSGTTLTFDTAPANGTSIDVTTHTQQTVNVPVDGSVSTAKVADDAVTLAKMAANSVDSDQYVDASIDTAHIKDAQVTTAKLAADAVTAAKLADNAVVTANIADDQVTTAKIADDQVTLAKLAGLARGKIIYGDSSGNPAALALGSNGQVLKSDGTDIAWATDATVAALTSEQVQDIAGAMFSSNTETGITATYQDGDGTIDLVIGDDTIVSSMLDTNIAIAGTLGVTGNLNSTADIVLTKTGTDDAGIKFATANANRYIASDENGVVSIGTGTTLTGGTQYVTIDSGNVGIGVTPSTWPSNGDFVGLQVGSGLSLYGRGSGDQDRVGMTANAYVDTNDSRFEYIASGHATHFSHTDGNFRFYTAPSGSANGAITFTERLTVLNGGDVGIGITPSAKFMVNQTATDQPCGYFYQNVSGAQNCLQIINDGAGNSGSALYVRNDGSGNAITVDDGSGGNTIFAISYIGSVLFQDGSATQPSISNIDDSNTGMFFGAGDNIMFTCGGTQRAFLSASQWNVAGNLVASGTKNFRVQHLLPSKKETHELVHASLEGPQLDLIYRGAVDLVAGSATVNIDTAAGMTDGTFVLLNTNIQCFTSNESGWTAIKGSVSGNTLTITAQDNSCTDTISWMVVGERQDQDIMNNDMTDNDGKLIVEPLKIG